jgi:hypothetical protein
MSSHTRIILGFLGLVTAGFAVRALQTGIFYGRDFRPWDRNENPRVFALHMLSALLFIVWCGFAAAGFSMPDIFASLGLGAFFPQR